MRPLPKRYLPMHAIFRAISSVLRELVWGLAQRAMAVAKLYPEPEKGGRGKKNPSPNEGFIAGGYISQARTVLRWLPELADHVLAGTTPLNEPEGADVQREQSALTLHRKGVDNRHPPRSQSSGRGGG